MQVLVLVTASMVVSMGGWLLIGHISELWSNGWMDQTF